MLGPIRKVLRRKYIVYYIPRNTRQTNRPIFLLFSRALEDNRRFLLFKRLNDLACATFFQQDRSHIVTYRHIDRIPDNGCRYIDIRWIDHGNSDYTVSFAVMTVSLRNWILGGINFIRDHPVMIRLDALFC